LCASDLAQAILTYAENPRGAVYNMGGGRANSISVLEAIKYLKKLGHSMPTLHGPQRLGDHKFWITDLRRFQGDYPEWKPEVGVYEVMDAMAQRYQE
jgi:CDP-paratose 2-epimerase